MKSIERGQRRQGWWVTNKFVLSKLISFAAGDDDFEDENHNNHCDYYCQTYHQRWRQHCALQWLHCVHCSVFTLFKLFSLPELIFVATGGRDFFPGVVKCFQKTTWNCMHFLKNSRTFWQCQVRHLQTWNLSKKITRPTFWAKEFHTLKTPKLRPFSQTKI